MAHGDGYLHTSVTQYLSVLDKPKLTGWFKKNTPEFIKRVSNEGKKAGTDIHTILEKSILGEEMTVDTEYPEAVNNAVNSFLLFKKENPKMKLRKAEIILNIGKYHYSGKLDVLGEYDGEIFIGDWKTGKSYKNRLTFYPEMSAQVSAYCKGYSIQYDVPIKKAIIVLLDKTSVKYAIKELDENDINESFENMFLPCVKIYRHLHKKKEKK